VEGSHPGRMHEPYPKILRALTVSPLASPEDPLFAKLMLTPEMVRPVLDSAREQVFGHALDMVLQPDPKLAENDVYEGVAKLFGTKRTDGLDRGLSKQLPGARARATVVKRFVIRPKMSGRKGADPLPDATTARSFTPPIPVLARSFSGIAMSNVPPDPDGVMRRLPLLRRVEDGVLPGLSLVLYLQQLGFSLDRPEEISRAMSVEAGPMVRIQPPKGPEVRIPVDKSGSMLVRMQGRAESVLQILPLAMVITYNGFKQERKDFQAEKDPERRRDFFEPMGETADELMAGGNAPVTFDELVERAKAGGMLVVLPFDAVVSDPKADPKQPRAPSEWRTLLDGAYEAILAGYEKTQVEQLAKFRKRPEEQQKKSLEKEGSPWPAHIYRVARMTELAHMKVELANRLKGRYVIIGAAQTGNTDAAPTAFGPKEPNYALHGHSLATLAGGKFVRKLGHRDATLIPVVTVAFLLGFVLPNVSLLAGAIFALSLLIVWGMASTALLAYAEVWVDMVSPAVSIGATYLVLSVWRYKTVEQSKQVYRNMFEAYLDKRVIEQFVEQPELFREIGGVSCEITAFFSDIEGFTTISELLSPEQLSAMLRDYLTPMTNIIQGRGGLRDKYIGDAIVAMFGAPLHTPDHAVQACLASIEQRTRLDALKQDAKLLADPKSWLSHLKAKGRDFNARMGVNTGMAKVGNFGSETSKNYTMIGDTVNLAARLEGANKAFGTYLMISEFTYAQAKDYIEARPLDSIRVKGKLRPVTVYELMAKKGELSEQMIKVREIFVHARNLYLEQRWDEAIAKFQEGLAIKPDDAPCLTLMHRSEHFKEEPPAKDWDGTYDLKEK
jgi:class 3 adenylate cyclase/CHASE2 domain-containing sensor protein